MEHPFQRVASYPDAPGLASPLHHIATIALESERLNGHWKRHGGLTN